MQVCGCSTTMAVHMSMKMMMRMPVRMCHSVVHVRTAHYASESDAVRMQMPM